MVCLDAPEFFHAVGAFYRDFTQTQDDDVVDLLQRAAVFSRPQGDSPGGER